MLNVSKLRVRERAFGRLVGLSGSQFDVLVEAVATEEARRRSEGAPDRLRAVGGGRKFTLALEERVLAALLYYRLHLTGHLLSCLFELDESNLWRDRTFHLQPLLLDVLPVPMQDHLLSCLDDPHSSKPQPQKPRRKRIGTLQELLEAYPELRDVCVDGTEQKVPRPKNKAKSRKFYSGKSHCHTLKTQVTSAKRLILHLFGNVPGQVADRLMLKASGVVRALDKAASAWTRKAKGHKRPPRLTKRRLFLDRGYSGIETSYPDVQRVQILAALKGTGRHKVTLLGQLWNRRLVSRTRIQIEQNIGHLKNFRVWSGSFRAQTHKHHDTVRVVAGLHNFRQLGKLAW